MTIRAVLMGLVWGMAATSFAGTEQWTVSGLANRTCQAYLHQPEAQQPTDLVVSLKGTGFYTTADPERMDVAVRPLWRANRVSVLTLDKPGIHANQAAPLGYRVDYPVYNQFVQGDLVRCAMEALEQVQSNYHRIFISGHSEGAQIAVKLVEAAKTSPTFDMERIQGLFLSSAPLVTWRELLALQLSPQTHRRYLDAIAKGDHGILYQYGALSASYLSQMFLEIGLQQSFLSLGQEWNRIPVVFYHGAKDRMTPVGPLRKMLTYLKSLPTKAKVRARYYKAGHALNARAVRDITNDLVAILQVP